MTDATPITIPKQVNIDRIICRLKSRIAVRSVRYSECIINSTPWSFYNRVAVTLGKNPSKQDVLADAKLYYTKKSSFSALLADFIISQQNTCIY